VVEVVPAPGDVAAIPLPGGDFGALQVTGADDGSFGVCALAWHSARPPTLAQLDGAGPLVLDHHTNPGRPAHLNVPAADPVPPGLAWLGRRPVPAGLPPMSPVSSGWAWLPAMVAAQRRWDRDLPDAAKRAYRAAGTRGRVDVDFGAGPVTMWAPTAALDLTGAGPVRVPASGPVRGAALDALPRSTGLAWAGPDRGLIAALAARPIVDGLLWRDPPAEADLSATGLQSVDLAAGEIRRLRLPRTVQTLRLAADAHVHEVDAAEDGRWLRLVLDAAPGAFGIPAGLRGVRDVLVTGDGVIPAGPLRDLPGLEELELMWGGPPGRLTGADALAGLDRLAVVQLAHAYAFDATTLPDLPALVHLNLYGLRASVAAGLRARYRGSGVRLVLAAAKNDAWLAANLTNPLRDWVHDDARAGAAACKAYATALRAIDRRPADAERILGAFVDRLNAIDAEHDIIDTLRREQAGDAFLGLAARAGVPQEVADAWFDARRTF
jgi:hypothetical protein